MYMGINLHQALATEGFSVQPALNAVAILSTLPAQRLDSQDLSRIELTEYPPPGSPPSAISVLRI